MQNRAVVSIYCYVLGSFTARAEVVSIITWVIRILPLVKTSKRNIDVITVLGRLGIEYSDRGHFKCLLSYYRPIMNLCSNGFERLVPNLSVSYDILPTSSVFALQCLLSVLLA
jgi:hypothetical protein